MPFSVKTFTIPFSKNITNIKFNENGSTISYKMQIINYDDWQCEQPAPDDPYDTTYMSLVFRKYRNQQIMSIDVYKNLFKYSAANNILDT